MKDNPPSPKQRTFTEALTSALSFSKAEVQKRAEYVRGGLHTQGIENFWSLLKRTLKGTYVAVEAFHLEKYLAEQVFRFNNRTQKRIP